MRRRRHESYRRLRFFPGRNHFTYKEETTVRQYVIDAFTDHVFAGNPAAVCVMDKWLDEEKMMAITIENNLSETAFAVKEGEKYLSITI